MDESHEADLGGSKDEATSGSGAGPSIGATRAAMSMGEQLLALGAALLVLVDLVAGLILDEFYVANLPWFLAVVAMAAIVFKRFRSAEGPFPYQWLLKFLGYSVLFLTIYYMLIDLRNGFYDGADIFWALVTYLGGAIMGFGAYRMSQEG